MRGGGPRASYATFWWISVAELNLHFLPPPIADFLSGVVQWERRNRHLQVEYQLNAAVRAVALDARESLHTLASDTHPLGALESPAAELQDAARVETPHRNCQSLAYPSNHGR